jgi:hypothetical protein
LTHASTIEPLRLEAELDSEPPDDSVVEVMVDSADPVLRGTFDEAWTKLATRQFRKTTAVESELTSDAGFARDGALRLIEFPS